MYDDKLLYESGGKAFNGESSLIVC